VKSLREISSLVGVGIFRGIPVSIVLRLAEEKVGPFCLLPEEEVTPNILVPQLQIFDTYFWKIAILFHIPTEISGKRREKKFESLRRFMISVVILMKLFTIIYKYIIFLIFNSF